MWNRAARASVLMLTLWVTDSGCDSREPESRTLAVDSLTKFLDPLVVPPTIDAFHEDGAAYELTMGMWEIHQQLHSELPPTYLWAYGETQESATYPGPTIEARTGFPIAVRWENHLPDHHFLPVDETIHWAAPPSWPGHGVPTVVHVHGGLQEAASDGHPDAWFTADFEQRGHEFVKEVYEYPNANEPEHLWYHDHALGITRLNVYAGLAGFYFLRDPELEDALELPSGAFEVPLLIQDRSFDADGSLAYPTTGVNPDVHPEWVSEFFSDVNLVNGVVWPHLEVQPRRYRFIVLNAANARFYGLSLSNGEAFTQIGTDGGYLGAPVEVDHLLLAPAERADIVIDFTDAAPNTTIELRNDAAAPYPGGDAVTPHTAAVMQFRVVALEAPDDSTIPEALVPVPDLGDPDVVQTHTLVEVIDDETQNSLGVYLDGRHWGDHGEVTELPTVGSTELWEIVNTTDDAHPIHLHLIDFRIVDRQPVDIDSYKATFDMLNPTIPALETTNPGVDPYLMGAPVAPAPNEAGWKDTVLVPPGEVTRILVRWAPESGEPFPFDPTAEPGYVWHCHILEHEDSEMMRRIQLQD